MSQVNPYASPQHIERVVTAQVVAGSQAGGGIWRQGSVLVMHKGALLPDICVKCNQPCSGPRLKRNLYWHHPAIFLALLLTQFGGVLLYIILALVLRKKATIWIPLSPSWWARRRRAMMIGWGLFVLGFALIVASPILAEAMKIEAFFAGIFLGIAVAIGGGIYGLVAARMIAAKKIDDQYVWIKGIHPDYLATLPALGGG